MSAWIDQPPTEQPRRRLITDRAVIAQCDAVDALVRAITARQQAERATPAPTPATLHHRVGGALDLDMLAGASEAVGAALPRERRQTA